MRARVSRALAGLRGSVPGQLQFWLLAALIGTLSGAAAVAFREGVGLVVRAGYGTGPVAWPVALALPVAGGLAVGLILHRFTPDARVRAVADVIEGAAANRGRVEVQAGIASAAASLITLGTGGSTGREGPVVHLAGVVATLVSTRIGASAVTARDLLGCGVAAAVSASFNAPIAGTLFALEVVLRHFAPRAFAPIAIAAVAGTVVDRLALGNTPEFHLDVAAGLGFYVELPAFVLLGLVSGLVAAALMRGTFWAEDAATRGMNARGLHRTLRPMLAGVLLGLLAIPFPEIAGVGYETTAKALGGGLGFGAALMLALAKGLAVAVTIAGRMGGGVFSPGLVVGSLVGLAFGIVAHALLPAWSSGPPLYALAGMGAVAAAVLGAPISTTLIVFELTADWQTGIAVMASVAMASAVASRLVRGSFFLEQLERRGIRIASGPGAWMLTTIPVAGLMNALDGPTTRLDALMADGFVLGEGATLDQAMPMFGDGRTRLPVLGPEGKIAGVLTEAAALRAWNRALAATVAEEHA